MAILKRKSCPNCESLSTLIVAVTAGSGQNGVLVEDACSAEPMPFWLSGTPGHSSWQLSRKAVTG